MSIQDIIIIFSLLKDGKINQYLCKSAIDSLRKDSKFNYIKYFEESIVTDKKLEEVIMDVISENEEIIIDITNGNNKKIGVLLGKVLNILGKGVDSKKISLMILVQIDIRKRILMEIFRKYQKNSLNNFEILPIDNIDIKYNNNKLALVGPVL
jgi:Asp-tRNA(Asn)/Glu-tRNA(Gln) amidotransferase B subunit